MAHICVSNSTIIGPDNGLSPGRRQAIIWTNAGILLIGAWGTNLSEILISIHTFSFKKIHLKMSSGKWRPFCLGLNVLRQEENRSRSNSVQNERFVFVSCIDGLEQDYNSSGTNALELPQFVLDNRCIRFLIDTFYSCPGPYYLLMPEKFKFIINNI